MLRRIAVVLIPLVSLLGLSAPASALTLEQALTLAAKEQPALAAARAGQAQALAGLDQARAGWRPTVTLALSASRMDDPAGSLFAKLSQGNLVAADLTPPEALNDPGPLTDIASAVNLRQSLYSGGRVSAGIRLGSAGLAGADAELNAAHNRVHTQVTRAYYGYLLAQQAVQVVEQAQSTAEAQLASVRHRIEAGAAVRADQLAAVSRLARISGQVITRHAQLQLARVALAASLGRDELPSEPGGSLPEPAELTTGVDELLSTALSRHPRLTVASSRVSRQKAAGDMARSGLLPSIGLSASAADHRPSLSGDSGTLWQVGVLAEWPLTDGGAARAALAKARAAERQATAERKMARIAVRTQVIQATTTRSAARQRYQAAQSEVTAAAEWARLAADRYELGAALLTHLQEAQDHLESARLDLLTARHDVAVADAQLEEAIGGPF